MLTWTSTVKGWLHYQVVDVDEHWYICIKPPDYTVLIVSLVLSFLFIRQKANGICVRQGQKYQMIQMDATSNSQHVDLWNPCVVSVMLRASETQGTEDNTSSQGVSSKTTTSRKFKWEEINLLHEEMILVMINGVRCVWSMNTTNCKVQQGQISPMSTTYKKNQSKPIGISPNGRKQIII